MKLGVWLIFREGSRIKGRIFTINAVIARQREWQGKGRGSGEWRIAGVRKKAENQDADTTGLWNNADTRR